MTNKEKTLIAIDELIKKYKETKLEHLSTTPTACPLCIIHRGRDIINFSSNCKGCPLVDNKGSMGCIEFKSFKNLENIMEEFKYYSENDLIYDAIQNRINFWNYAKPLIEKHPNEHFTKKGWKYFNELDRTR